VCIWPKNAWPCHNGRPASTGTHSLLTRACRAALLELRRLVTAGQMVRDILGADELVLSGRTGVPQAILESGLRPSRREASLVSPITDPNHPRLRLESH
jgi:hypothetical protein